MTEVSIPSVPLQPDPIAGRVADILLGCSCLLWLLVSCVAANAFHGPGCSLLAFPAY